MNKLLLLFCLLPVLIFSAENDIKLHYNNEVFYLPVVTKNNTKFFSLNSLADLMGMSSELSADKRLVIKGNFGTLTHTVLTPFFVIKTDNHNEVFQLPISTRFDKDVYIPLEYSGVIIEKISGQKVEIKGSDIFVKPLNNNKAIKDNSKDKTKDNQKDIPKEKKAFAFDVYDVDLDVKLNGTLVKFKSNKALPEIKHVLEEDILTITVDADSPDLTALNKIEPSGVIRRIKFEVVDKKLEAKLTLSKDFTNYEVVQSSGKEIFITLHNKVLSKSEKPLEKKQKVNVIVIDAGHGGKDAGAIGVNGLKEKDVNLSIALSLGDMIERLMPDVDVVYTRKDDSFVELYKRGKIANEKNGNLFISIHCNSTPEKPSAASGYEVFLLRPGKTKEAIKIAERENSVIEYEENKGRYQELTDENFIMVSMAHSSYMKYSEKFSDLLNTQFDNYVKPPSRGIKQAGFYVLVGASMPSVLIETGFLSNKDDAEYLATAKGRYNYALSIFNGIKKYKEFYESNSN